MDGTAPSSATVLKFIPIAQSEQLNQSLCDTLMDSLASTALKNKFGSSARHDVMQVLVRSTLYKASNGNRLMLMTKNKCPHKCAQCVLILSISAAGNLYYRCWSSGDCALGSKCAKDQPVVGVKPYLKEHLRAAVKLHTDSPIQIRHGNDADSSKGPTNASQEDDTTRTQLLDQLRRGHTIHECLGISAVQPHLDHNLVKFQCANLRKYLCATPDHDPSKALLQHKLDVICKLAPNVAQFVAFRAIERLAETQTVRVSCCTNGQRIDADTIDNSLSRDLSIQNGILSAWSPDSVRPWSDSSLPPYQKLIVWGLIRHPRYQRTVDASPTTLMGTGETEVTCDAEIRDSTSPAYSLKVPSWFFAVDSDTAPIIYCVDPLTRCATKRGNLNANDFPQILKYVTENILAPGCTANGPETTQLQERAMLSMVLDHIPKMRPAQVGRFHAWKDGIFDTVGMTFARYGTRGFDCLPSNAVSFVMHEEAFGDASIALLDHPAWKDARHPSWLAWPHEAGMETDESLVRRMRLSQEEDIDDDSIDLLGLLLDLCPKLCGILQMHRGMTNIAQSPMALLMLAEFGNIIRRDRNFCTSEDRTYAQPARALVLLGDALRSKSMFIQLIEQVVSPDRCFRSTVSDSADRFLPQAMLDYTLVIHPSCCMQNKLNPELMRETVLGTKTCVSFKYKSISKTSMPKNNIAEASHLAIFSRQVDVHTLRDICTPVVVTLSASDGDESDERKSQSVMIEDITKTEKSAMVLLMIMASTVLSNVYGGESTRMIQSCEKLSEYVDTCLRGMAFCSAPNGKLNLARKRSQMRDNAKLKHVSDSSCNIRWNTVLGYPQFDDPMEEEDQEQQLSKKRKRRNERGANSMTALLRTVVDDEDGMV